MEIPSDTLVNHERATLCLSKLLRVDSWQGGVMFFEEMRDDVTRPRVGEKGNFCFEYI